MGATNGSEAINNIVADLAAKHAARRAARMPVYSQAQIDILARAFKADAPSRAAVVDSRPDFWSRAINGAMTQRFHAPIFSETADADENFARALQTSATPGQYVTPTIEANSFIEQLSLGSTFRRAGATIWPCAGIENLTIPVGITSPQWLFMAQNSRQSPDPNFNAGQISFTLKEHRALLEVPLQLFRAARPALSSLLPTFLALGAGESEDIVLHASTNQSDAPGCLMQASGVTFINTASSGNGGNIAVSDIIGMIQKAAETKLRFPWCWFASPRTLTRLFSLLSTTSQLLLNPPTTINGEWSLCGWPLYLTNSISNSETLGSGSSQSHLILCNPSAVHIAEDHRIAFEVSDEFLLDSAAVALRIIHHIDAAFAPGAGFIILRGIN